MKNIYLIVSDNKIVIDLNIDKIKKQLKDYEEINYDLEETLIDNLIEDLDTYNFFQTSKLVIGHHASFLTGDKQILEHDLDKLIKYINNPNPANYLILICNSLDKRKKIVAELIKKVELLEPIISKDDIIKNNLEDYKMDNKTINFLIDYCGQNDERILNELNKLKMYKIEDKIINIDDIKEIVKKDIDDNIFTLIDDIVNGNKKEAFEIYNDLLLHGEQVNNIISKLANKIRLIYQVKILVKDNKSDTEISKLLNMHPYPIKLAREISINYTEKMLLEYLNKLADIDYNLKSGNGNPQVIFETFIAEI